MQKKIALALLLAVMTLGLFGCPSQPTTKSGPVYSDPEAARARAAERTKELDTNIQK
jgi:outer membrane lipoprotein SlyB